MHTDYIPTTSLDKSLIAVDAATGLIITTARSMPEKRLVNVDMKILLDKYNDSSFALKYNRNRIELCVDVGLDLKIFLELCLRTLIQISDQLNL